MSDKAKQHPTKTGQQRVFLLRNPKAGSGARAAMIGRLCQLLDECGLRTETFTDLDLFASETTKAWANGELRSVLAGGGDGTVSTVVNLIEPGIPVAMFPMGTENLLAKHIGWEAVPEVACRTICDHRVVRFDAGEANGRLFLIMASCGFDAEVVNRLHANRTGNISHWTYFRPIYDSISEYRFPRLHVHLQTSDSESETIDITSRWTFVTNIPQYAWGLITAPEADGSDGLLDVCTFEKSGFFNGLRYALGIAMGSHLDSPGARMNRATKISIEADGPAHYQLDGDPGGPLPVEIRVLPQRLTFLVPPTWKN